MLHKFFPFRRLTPSFLRQPSPKPVQSSSSTSSSPPETAAVKIIHVGGFVEYYYMAVPARGIMEKYPSFLLARPEIFRRPWEPLVRPEEILTPGEKFYVVPRRTVRKLRRRIKRPPTREFSQNCTPGQSSDDISMGHNSRHYMDSFSSASSDSLSKSFYVGKSVSYGDDAQSATYIVPSEDLLNNKKATSAPEHPPSRRKKTRKRVMWHPTLTVISEASSPARGGAGNNN